MATSFSQIATNMVASLGYAGLALGLVVDSMGIPIPSEVLLPLAGALAKEGKFELWIVIVVGTLAQTLGAVIAYHLGKGPGLGLVKKYGKYVLFSEHELERTQKLFDRWGSWLTFFGRCMPGIRTYIGYPAGITRMHYGKFVAASLAGSLLWTVFLTYLGYTLADHLDVIDSFLSKFGYLILAIGLIFFIWYVHRSVQRNKKADKA